MSGKVVCVTGASGYIASWLVKLLLERGYTVRGTVRDPDDPKKTEHLLALEGASERLHLFKANLVEEGSFDAVIDGCEGVFHTASPITSVKTDPEAELIEPALKGTLNVLGSCAKSSSVKRIVLTSSMVTLYNDGRPKISEVTLDETWFSSVEFCRENKAFEKDDTTLAFEGCNKTLSDGIPQTWHVGGVVRVNAHVEKTQLNFTELWYDLSKTLAEEAAWKFAKENGLDLITLHPALVIGPLLQPSLNASCGLVLSMISGSPVFPNYTLGYVNVKDVALGHILAFENPSATGRYCLVERVEHLSKFVKHIHDLYPELQLPEKCADDKPYPPEYNVSKEKAKSLDINFIPLEVSLKETIESLVEKNLAKI